MSNHEAQMPSPQELIVDELIGLIIKNEEVRLMDGKRVAAAHWTEVRDSFLKGEGAMPDDVFTEFVAEAMRKITAMAREERNG